jgi:Trk K+ transport system NAD-binding subunit
VPGDPTSEIVLARADIEHANTAIVLSDPEEGNRADTKSVLIALAVEAIQPRVHTIVELLHSRNRIHFRHTYVDEIVCMDELTEKLLAQSALTHGVSEFYIRLLTATEDTNEVYVIAVPGPFVGRTYRELERALIEFDEENVILVGVQTVETRLDGEREVTNHFGRRLQERVLTINPPSQSELEQREDLRQCRLKHRDYVLQASDKLFLIAYCPPVLDGLAPS